MNTKHLVECTNNKNFTVMYTETEDVYDPVILGKVIGSIYSQPKMIVCTGEEQVAALLSEETNCSNNRIVLAVLQTLIENNTLVSKDVKTVLVTEEAGEDDIGPYRAYTYDIKYGKIESTIPVIAD